MTRHVALGLSFLGILCAFGTNAQEASVERIAAGEAIYTENCAVCHQPGGGGTADFPALAGNRRLVDLSLIVTNVHHGKEAMPAFPDLGAEEIAAIAGYIRNAWVNVFGPASVDEVAAVLDRLEDAGPRVSVWTGVFTEEQANRGKAAHRGTCSRCHGRRLNGAGEPDMDPAPAIARVGFLKKWEGQTVATLYALVRLTMPPSNPGFLSDQQYLDAIAYIFQVSGMPPGAAELPLDLSTLASFVIEPNPGGG